MLLGEDRTAMRAVLKLNLNAQWPPSGVKTNCATPAKGTPLNLTVSKKDRRRLDAVSRSEFVGSRPFVGFYCGRGTPLLERKKT